MSNKGFASMTRKRRAEVGSKGGRNAQSSGKAHAYNPVTAKINSMKAVAVRKRKAVNRAAVKLMECGFTASQLAALNLTYEEYLYYSKDSKSALELIKRLEDLSGPTDPESL